MSRDMRKRRNVIEVEFWSDTFVRRALKIDQAFFYCMLITRWPEQITGIIEVSAAELYAGFRPEEFPLDRLLATLALLEGEGKIIYEASTLWIVNYFKRHGEIDGRPDWFVPVIARTLSECHSRAIYDGFIEKYASHPLFPLSVPPYRYGPEGQPPTWFLVGGPEKKKRPPIKQEPAIVERVVPEIRAEVARVWEAYTETMDSTLSLTDKRRAKILARLSDKIIDRSTKVRRSVTPDDLIAVIRACRASAFHMGGNEGGKRYNLPEEHLFRSQEQMEKWLQEASTNHRPAPPAPSRSEPKPEEDDRPPMTDEERADVEREAAAARAKTRELLSGVMREAP